MADKQWPSLENLVELEDLGLEVLHPGGLDITLELSRLCRIGKGTTVLDVAAGTGASACYLVEVLGARVIGIDVSGLMIERARNKARQRNLEIEFIEADAHRLPFADLSFDSTISECTTCLLDKERAIREMARVVKHSGHVGIHDICWKEGVPGRIRKRLAELEGEDPETLEGWKAVFEKAGLVDVSTVDKSMLMPVWMKGIRRQLGWGGQLRIFLKIIGRWGIGGLRNILASEKIFRSRFTGYGIIVGRKP